jgi:hypothetical protein
MTKKPFGDLKVLIYDIETSPLKAYIWRCGDQVVRHTQLDPAFAEYKITTIAYKWIGDKTVHCLSEANKIEVFDEQVRKADVCIGKNSDNFDVKHINTQRMLQKLSPLPEWLETNDDLEKQLRKYFIFPSMSLDYISNQFGLGGKVKMEFQDWIDIENYKLILSLYNNQESLAQLEEKDHICNTLFKIGYLKTVLLGKSALDKMIVYNKKDVRDTENILLRIAPHVKLRHNAAKDSSELLVCRQCGGTKLIPTKIIMSGKTKFQQFHCIEHNGYAGRSTFKWDKSRHKVFGRIS